MKQKKITPTMQKVAVDILEDIEIYMMQHKEVPDEITRLYNRVISDYGLGKDAFTGMVCTSDWEAKSRLKYEEQVMMERYGHCDGLE